MESRIWDKLNTKIAEINRVFGAVMEEKEDLFQLVPGMTPPAMFRDLFAYAPQDGDEEKLDRWYNAKTATFGGEDVFKVVQDMVGNAAKINYQLSLASESVHGAFPAKTASTIGGTSNVSRKNAGHNLTLYQCKS